MSVSSFPENRLYQVEIDKRQLFLWSIFNLIWISMGTINDQNMNEKRSRRVILTKIMFAYILEISTTWTAVYIPKLTTSMEQSNVQQHYQKQYH